MMFRTMLIVATSSAILALPATGLADHNSKWGEGWARMPNDIHNTRIDTRGDNTAFRDFVRYGNAADSENRFDTGASKGSRQQPGQSARNANMTGGRKQQSHNSAGRRH